MGRRRVYVRELSTSSCPVYRATTLGDTVGSGTAHADRRTFRRNHGRVGFGLSMVIRDGLITCPHHFSVCCLNFSSWPQPVWAEAT